MVFHKMMIKGQKGFSLVELLVVVGIIGVLAAVGVPQYTKYTARSKNSAALQMASNVSTAEEALAAQSLPYLNPSTAANQTTLMGKPLNITAINSPTVTGTAVGQASWSIGFAVAANSWGNCQAAAVNITANQGQAPLSDMAAQCQ